MPHGGETRGVLIFKPIVLSNRPAEEAVLEDLSAI